jgi:hypothetical protein
MTDLAGSMKTEPDNVTHLKGTPKNPGRDLKARAEGKGTMGDKALMDAILIVALAWVVVIALAYSLRHHNV